MIAARQHDQQRQAEAHLYFAGDRGAMRQRLGHGDADRFLQRRIAVESMGGGLPEAGTVIRRKQVRIGGMGLQQDASLGVADQVGKELFMRPDRRKALRHTLILAPDDVGHRQRQNAFGGHAQG
jgi:hypothetical protein